MSKRRIAGIIILVGAVVIGTALQFGWGLLFGRFHFHPPVTHRSPEGVVSVVALLQVEVHWSFFALFLAVVVGILYLLPRRKHTVRGIDGIS
jgi:hypothetical protein